MTIESSNARSSAPRDRFIAAVPPEIDRAPQAGGALGFDLLSPEALEARLKAVGPRRYHKLHPFHRLLHAGRLGRPQIEAWALNRYYYQAMIPVKDAAVLSRMDDPALRRVWRSRLVDHDGETGGRTAGIGRWLALTDSLGLDRDLVVSTAAILPGTRFAVDAYVTFCRERPTLEAVASSLTEMFVPDILAERIPGMLAAYPFVSAETLGYFDDRKVLAPRDAAFALAYVKRHADTPDKQAAVVAALEFKCAVLWAMLDALHFAYVEPGIVPPGCYLPAERA